MGKAQLKNFPWTMRQDKIRHSLCLLYTHERSIANDGFNVIDLHVVPTANFGSSLQGSHKHVFQELNTVRKNNYPGLRCFPQRFNERLKAIPVPGVSEVSLNEIPGDFDSFPIESMVTVELLNNIPDL